MKNLKIVPDTELMYDVDTLMVYPVKQLYCCNLQGGVSMKDLPDGDRQKCIESYMKDTFSGKLFDGFDIKVVQK